MSDLAQFAVVTFTSILFLVDPIAIVPAYLAFTRKEKRGRDIGCAAGADRGVLLVRPDAAVAGVARQCAWRMRRASNPSKGSDALRRDGINPLNSKEIVRALRRLSKPFC